MTKTLLTLFFALMLCPCTGCSDSDNAATGSAGAGVAASDMVVYEANPRIFATYKAFDAITSDLDRIKSLGATVLWLMPVNEPGVERSVGSPYCIKDYLTLNQRYGTENDLKKLVSTAHAKGMKVIIDWVANHTSWDNKWISEHPDWYTHDNDGNIISPAGQPWTDVADLNYDNSDMRRAMTDAMKHWVTAVGIDGFRCDYAEGVPDDFWLSAVNELRGVRPDLLMLAEGGKAGLTDCGFNMVYGWDFQTRLKELYSGAASVADLYTTESQEWQGMPAGTTRLRYSTNHDQASEQSPVVSYGGKRGAMSAFVLATMFGGVPLIYSSQEAAYAEPLNFFDYKQVDMNADKDFADEMSRIVSAYKNTEVIRGGELKTYLTGKAVTFRRKQGDKMLFVVVNPTNTVLTVKTPIELNALTMTDMIRGGNVKLGPQLTLEPYGYMILTK